MTLITDEHLFMSRYKHVIVDGKTQQAHRVIWENANGPIPDGYDIHHKDGNPHNNSLDNLMCLSHKDHLSLHAKQRDKGAEPEPTDIVIKDRKYLKTHYEKRRKSRIAKQKEYYEAHREEIRAQRARHLESHREEINARDRARYAVNREAICARGKKYRETHKEEVAARKSDYYRRNKDKVLEYQAKYHEEKREAIAVQQAKYYQEHKAEHLAYNRLNRAMKAGKPQEEIDALRAAWEAVKLPPRRKK